MADAEDSKSSVRKHMRVQVPPSATQQILNKIKYLQQKTARDGERAMSGESAESYRFCTGQVKT